MPPTHTSTARDMLYDRQPPVNVEAEMALLGALILKPEAMDEILVVECAGGGEVGVGGEVGGDAGSEAVAVGTQGRAAPARSAGPPRADTARSAGVPNARAVAISEGMFHAQVHADIWRVLATMYVEGQTGNLVVLTHMLEGAKSLEVVGGLRYLEKLASETPGPACVRYYAQIVADCYVRRRLIEIAGDVVHKSYAHVGQGTSAMDVLDLAERGVLELGDACRVSGSGDLESLKVLAERQLTALYAAEDGRGEVDQGVRVGFDVIDRLTSGFKPGEMVCLGARPSMGKTALAVAMALGAAVGLPPEVPGEGQAERDARLREAGGVVLFFSLEMGADQIAQRCATAVSGVPMPMIQAARVSPLAMSEQDRRAVYGGFVRLSELAVQIDQSVGVSVAQMRSKVRRAVRRTGVRLVVIDYLQLCTAGKLGGVGGAKGYENRQAEVSEISRQIKVMAQECGVPVLVLSQLSRALETRQDKRPMLSDLRESGAIEQDADVVMFLHREEYFHQHDRDWMERNRDEVGTAEVIVAKNRNGPTGVCRLGYESRCARFYEIVPSGVPVSPFAAGG